jgi:hypothetical protein
MPPPRSSSGHRTADGAELADVRLDLNDRTAASRRAGAQGPRSRDAHELDQVDANGAELGLEFLAGRCPSSPTCASISAASSLSVPPRTELYSLKPLLASRVREFSLRSLLI